MLVYFKFSGHPLPFIHTTHHPCHVARHFSELKSPYHELATQSQLLHVQQLLHAVWKTSLVKQQQCETYHYMRTADIEMTHAHTQETAIEKSESSVENTLR